MKIDRILGSRSAGRWKSNADLRRWRSQAGRVTAREYLPLAGWILSWTALTAALGLAEAIMLMAANGFVQAIRSLFLLQSFDAVSARLDCAPEAKTEARRVALRADATSLVGCLAMLLPFAFSLSALGLGSLASMLLIMTIGLPARTPALLYVDRRRIGVAWRIGAAAAMVAGATLVFLLRLDWMWAALFLALREWGGLLAVWATRRPQASITTTPLPDLDFAEIAARSSLAARRRLVYRIGKVALSLFGPVGSFLARTGRGTGLDGRLARRLEIMPAYVALLAFACCAAAGATVIVSQEPAALLIASVIARIAAASLSVLVWWRWSDGAAQFDWLNDDL